MKMMKPKTKTHAADKPHLRARKLSSIGKSAFSAPPSPLAFAPGPDAGGAPAFPPPDMSGGGGAPPMAAPAGPPGMPEQ